MVRVQAEVDTPIVPIWMSDRTGEGHRKMIDGGLMPMRAISSTLLAIRRFMEHGRWRAGFDPNWSPSCAAGAAQQTVNLSEAKTKALLEEAGITVPRGEVVRSASEAAQAFTRVGNGKAVMKISSAKILHKTDIGGVRLNVTSEADAAAAFARSASEASASSYSRT
ncbi:hypothetical protein AWB74_06421 [Caballeronia arvi]|uniref:ATP-grasp domain-containing protein n=1 Tax=Caballeronia arvi TaxID=1777135 RepID=A0A158KP20_9BURK|nr:hypothetical protein AWB74_06421 [Caballeronia arvi]